MKNMDSLYQNAPEFICPISLPKPISSVFQWKKASLGVHSLCLQPIYLQPLTAPWSGLLVNPWQKRNKRILPPVGFELTTSCIFIHKKLCPKHKKQQIEISILPDPPITVGLGPDLAQNLADIVQKSCECSM